MAVVSEGQNQNGIHPLPQTMHPKWGTSHRSLQHEYSSQRPQKHELDDEGKGIHPVLHSHTSHLNDCIHLHLTPARYKSLLYMPQSRKLTKA